MAGFVKKILKISLAMAFMPVIAFAVQQQNPRTVSGRLGDSDTNASIRRSATSVIARNINANARQTRTVVTARPATNQSVVSRSARPIVNNKTLTRAANKNAVARSATTTKKNTVNVSRAGTARATAVFNDITKIGGGYADCRDSYATCMDQFCANANDTYRRCYCSDRFITFRETADKLDTAIQMLAQFQDNNLNAVDKSAAEVNAMYTATAGEEAIKRDTSASQKLLDSIGDVLSGKSSTNKKQGLTSLGVMDISDFSLSNDDMWGGTSSIFGNSGSDMSDLEGAELYNSAVKQCMEITRASCGSDAMFNLARSAYSIMVTQDCNAYEKNINAKKESVEETVRTAEKYLRDARLAEYRSHNSDDVNACLANVDTAMRAPTACGPNYEKCLDYTGQYINTTTGEPVFSQALFGLNSLIVLDGSADVLKANAQFDKWLDGKRMFATTALDSCRDLADTVWYEYKRAALIQIAQAQDEKIQQVKDSCVKTIKECYDKQTGAMNDLDVTETQSTGAIAAVTARGMCYDRVMACAALYGDPDGCTYDDATKTLSLTPVDGKKCGLQSLLTFVDTVDSVKVAEGCQSALTKYAHELCDEDIGTENPVKYGKCKTMPRAELRAAMQVRFDTFCAQDLVENDDSNTLQGDKDNSAFNTDIMYQVVKDVYDELEIAFTLGCENANGKWVPASEMTNPSPTLLNQDFYRKYYATSVNYASQMADLNLAENGWCINNSIQELCENIGGTFSTSDARCELEDSWYKQACEKLGGQWRPENGNCFIRYSELDDVDFDVPTPTQLRETGTIATHQTNGLNVTTTPITSFGNLGSAQGTTTSSTSSSTSTSTANTGGNKFSGGFGFGRL